MKTSNDPQFNHYYELHHKHLRLKGLQPKTIEAYTRALRRIGNYFDFQVDDLSQDQLLDYFHALLERLSWSAVKLDLYGLKFFYTHVLKKTWTDVQLVKPPRTRRIPDIISVDEVYKLVMATNKLSYRVFFFTLYSMGLRLGEGLRLQIGDIDATHQRVHIRNAKGNKDRLVPLPDNTLQIIRRFWSVHRHPQGCSVALTVLGVCQWRLASLAHNFVGITAHAAIPVNVHPESHPPPHDEMM